MALHWFKIRAFCIPGYELFNEECFKSYEMISQLCKQGSSLHKDISETMIKSAKHRYEGHYSLANYHYANGNYRQALKLYEKWTDCIAPKFYKLWLDERIYNPDYLGRTIIDCNDHIKLDVPVKKPDSITDYVPGMENSIVGA